MLDSLIGDIFRCIDHFIDVDLDFYFFVQNLIRHFKTMGHCFRQIGTDIWESKKNFNFQISKFHFDAKLCFAILDSKV